MYDQQTGILLRRFREGHAAIPGFLDDYAFFVQGLLDLYETDFLGADLSTAIRLTGKMIELFEDSTAGAFFTTSGDDANLVLRIKDDYDGAEPAGNSIAILNLLRLAELTAEERYLHKAEAALRELAARISEQPFGVPQMLAAVEFHLAPKREITLAGVTSHPSFRDMLLEIRSRFLPNTSVLAMWPKLEGQTLAYVCENFVCKLPVSDRAALSELLQ
jgi:uncharacterized protein YyaL (SSP411 family)